MEVEETHYYSCYFSPNDSLETMSEKLDNLEESFRIATQDVIVAGYFNGKSPEWEKKRTDMRGSLVAELVARLNFVILNHGGNHTFRRGMTGSTIALTMTSMHAARKVSSLRVLEEVSLSDH